MAIGTPAVGGFTGQMHFVVTHANGAQFMFYPVLPNSGGSGFSMAASDAEKQALMQAMVTALDGHPDLTVSASLFYEAAATITP